MLIDLANHRPSFMPYKAVVLAYGRVKWRPEVELQAIPMIQDQESGKGGLLNDEESDLNQQLYDMDENRR